jgi:DNA-binding response OmpR family regulator
MSVQLQRAGAPNYAAGHVDNHVVLMVEDQQDSRSELKQVLELSGYRVIDTDNGQEAARRARQIQPDLLLVDLDVPLLYGLVAARQIIKHAQLEMLPVVIVTREDAVDQAPMMEVGSGRNEYVTRLSDYHQLEQLLDYLLPVSSPAPLQSLDRSAMTRL